MYIRVARPADAAAFVAIKSQLPIRIAAGETSTGGFLLGAGIEQYEEYLRSALCFAAEVDGQVAGFGIVLPNDQLRASDVWQRRGQADWLIDLPTYEAMPLSYFEQLAFLPGHRRLAIALAYLLVRESFAQGSAAMFTTTVRKPVLNIAALPFIHAARGRHAGRIDEHYEGIGPIRSDIYVMDRADFYSAVQAHPLHDFLLSAETWFKE